jgi:hypothetical protein
MSSGCKSVVAAMMTADDGRAGRADRADRAGYMSA